MWILYIIKCNDNSLYTGITTNVKKRISKHSNDQGAKYTRGRGPFKLVLKEKYQTRSQASKREYQIKQMSHLEKIELIKKIKYQNIIQK